MKLLHISDLHIGKRVGNFSMLENQEDILEKIYGIILEEKPAALLISGDVYDKAVPSAEAVTLFDDFLVKLSKIDGLSVFVISGNHDSAERIAFGRRLIDASGIHLSPVYNGVIEPITLEDEYGPVCFYMLPFIKPTIVKHFFPDDKINDYTDAISDAISHIEIDEAKRNVLLSHQAVIGALRSDSELNIGGLDSIDSTPYLRFDYVALGHVHTPQTVRKNHIRYCGSTLKYAFDECKQQKSVTIVELGKKGDVSFREVPLMPKHDFIQIEGLFEDICEKYRGSIVDHYTEVVLKDEMDVADAFRQLQNFFPKLIKLRYDNKRTQEKKIVAAARDVNQRSAFEIYSSLFEAMNNQPLTEEQANYLEQIIHEIEEEQE